MSNYVTVSANAVDYKGLAKTIVSTYVYVRGENYETKN